MTQNCSVAVIDLGSNAVRLAVGHAKTGTVLPVVTHFRREAHTMGKDVFETGTVAEKTLAQLARHFLAFQQEIADRNVQHICAWGTSALRDARNSQEVRSFLQHETGIALSILSGAQEAALSAKALAAALPTGHIAGIDVGGGSTEVCLILDGNVSLTTSFDIGSMRLVQSQDPATMLDTFEQACPRFPTHKPVSMAATGGSADAIVKVVCQAEGWPANTTAIPLPSLAQAVQTLAPLSPADRTTLWHVDPTRAETIVMAGKILLAGAAATGAHQLLLPGAGLVHGLLLTCLDECQGANTGNTKAEPASGPV